MHLDIAGEGNNTLNLFVAARQKAVGNANIYKHVWVVYDADDFPAGSIDKTADLCRQYSNDETEYHAIWSNQCIELWYLLHFSFMQSDLHRSEYWPKLSEWLKNIGQDKYLKNRDDMFEVLRPFMDIAIANAKRLEKNNEGKNPSKSSPGTKVYVLVDKLRTYL